MTQKRVVITGIGGLCGLGTNAHDIWNAMISGTNGVTPLVGETLQDMKVKSAGQIVEIPDIGLEHKQTITMDRFSLLAVTAAHEAMKQSGLEISETNAPRCGCHYRHRNLWCRCH